MLEKTLKSANGAAALDEVASKKLLKAYGIPVSKEEIAQTAADAVKIAKKIGFPWWRKWSAPTSCTNPTSAAWCSTSTAPPK